MKKRFPKNEMWREGRVPDQIDKGLGCLVIWRKLVGSKPARNQVRLNVMIIEQVKDGHKIVYIDDSP